MDIVKRLRKWLTEENTYKLLSDAADEIERLRKKIKEMENTRFMHDVISKANWNQVCRENEELRKALRKPVQLNLPLEFPDAPQL
jgi:hypothetical protein